VTADHVIAVAAKHFGIRPCDIIGPGRSPRLIKARFICCSIVRERLDLSYPELAKALGYGDHTAAINAVRQARVRRQTNDYWARDFDAIETALLDWREEREIERLEMF